jgi:hypothetical protein
VGNEFKNRSHPRAFILDPFSTYHKVLASIISGVSVAIGIGSVILASTRKESGYWGGVTVTVLAGLLFASANVVMAPFKESSKFFKNSAIEIEKKIREKLQETP